MSISSQESLHKTETTPPFRAVMKDSPSFAIETDLADRIKIGQQRFSDFYGREAVLVGRSPGRAEVIGSHVDYEEGVVIGCAINRSTLAFVAKRDDKKIRIRSNSYPDEEIVFDIDAIRKDQKHKWVNYAQAVVKELMKAGVKIDGADILIDSNVPETGGVSSSAAYELALASALVNLSEAQIEPTEVARLCKKAENSRLVRSPCGFLDQATSALSRAGSLLFMNFKPEADLPISEVKTIDLDLKEAGYSFVIVTDPAREERRNLGESGYPARKESCRQARVIFSELLGRNINSLSEVTVEEFNQYWGQLEAKGGTVVRKRAQHVIFEINRVYQAVEALGKGDIKRFGQLMTESGRSALERYELDQETPTLRFLVRIMQILSQHGVIGARNMGGGFCPTGIMLVRNENLKQVTDYLNQSYSTQFPGHHLDFIVSTPAQGTEVFDLSE